MHCNIVTAIPRLVPGEKDVISISTPPYTRVVKTELLQFAKVYENFYTLRFLE